MKDKFVWLGCFLLFLVGVVFGRLTFPSDFFKVGNVHDLFDMFGLLATVCAIFVALVGLNTWREQAKASADHELAAELIVALRQYQQEIIKCWYYAESSVAQIKNNTWIGSGGRDSYLVDIYERRLKDMQVSRVALESLELKCAELWGGIFDSGLKKGYQVEVTFCSFINSYLTLLISGTFDPIKEGISERALAHWKALIERGLVDEQSVTEFVEGLYSDFRLQLRRKMITV
jgi:hypothetical protein